jgi:putative FmdB family regulatory protein
MPLFEFRCADCGSQFEALLRRDESVSCPECAGDSLQRLMSAPAGHIAGSSLLPLAGGCPPADSPPCGPGCCRLPGA